MRISSDGVEVEGEVEEGEEEEVREEVLEEGRRDRGIEDTTDTEEEEEATKGPLAEAKEKEAIFDELFNFSIKPLSDEAPEGKVPG